MEFRAFSHKHIFESICSFHICEMKAKRVNKHEQFLNGRLNFPHFSIGDGHFKYVCGGFWVTISFADLFYMIGFKYKTRLT